MQSRLYVNDGNFNNEYTVNKDSENVCMEEDTNTHTIEIYVDDTNTCSKQKMHEVESGNTSRYILI